MDLQIAVDLKNEIPSSEFYLSQVWERSIAMRFVTYSASDITIPESGILEPLSVAVENIYTKKGYVAEVIPDLEELSELL